MLYPATLIRADILSGWRLPEVLTNGKPEKSLLPSPDDQHFIVAMLTNKAVALLQRKCRLFALANCGMAGAELADFLPVRDAGGRFTANILPVHIRTRTLQRIRTGGAERTRGFITIKDLYRAALITITLLLYYHLRGTGGYHAMRGSSTR